MNKNKTGFLFLLKMCLSGYMYIALKISLFSITCLHNLSFGWVSQKISILSNEEH